MIPKCYAFRTQPTNDFLVDLSHILDEMKQSNKTFKDCVIQKYETHNGTRYKIFGDVAQEEAAQHS